MGCGSSKQDVQHPAKAESRPAVASPQKTDVLEHSEKTETNAKRQETPRPKYVHGVHDGDEYRLPMEATTFPSRMVEEARIEFAICAVRGLADQKNNDVYVQYTLHDTFGDGDTCATEVVKSMNPTFKYKTIIDSVDVRNVSMKMSVKYRDVGFDDVLATSEFVLKDLEPFKRVRAWFPFKSEKDGVQIDVEIEYTYLPALRVEIVECSGTPATPEDDPFCEIHLDTIKKETRVFFDCQNPMWLEEFYFRTNREQFDNSALDIVVKDYECFGTDPELGNAMISLASIPLYHPVQQIVKLSHGGHVLARLEFGPLSDTVRRRHCQPSEMDEILTIIQECHADDVKRAKLQSRQLEEAAFKESIRTDGAVILGAYYYNVDVTSQLKTKQDRNTGKIELKNASLSDLFGDARCEMLVVIYYAYGKLGIHRLYRHGDDIIIPHHDDATLPWKPLPSSNNGLTVYCAYQDDVDITKNARHLADRYGFIHIPKDKYLMILHDRDTNGTAMASNVFIAASYDNRMMMMAGTEGIDTISINYTPL